MSVTGAVTLDFADHLRGLGQGWVVTPLVVAEEHIPQRGGYGHNSMLYWKRPPLGQSPTDFYAQNPPTGEFGFIVVKKPGSSLRVVQLFVNSDEQKVYLSYFRANGFKQEQPSFHKARIRNRKPTPPEGYDKLRLLLIRRAVRRGKKREYCKDFFELGSPELDQSVLVQTAAVLDKSLRHFKKGREPFDSGALCLVVEVEGHSFVIDPWLSQHF